MVWVWRGASLRGLLGLSALLPLCALALLSSAEMEDDEEEGGEETGGGGDG